MYLRSTRPLGWTPEERAALAVSADELRALPPAARAELWMRKRELDFQRRAAWWSAIAAIGTIAVPLATFLGLRAFVRR